jgi:hypothetical protein
MAGSRIVSLGSEVNGRLNAFAVDRCRAPLDAGWCWQKVFQVVRLRKLGVRLRFAVDPQQDFKTKLGATYTDVDRRRILI